ncbi:MAG: hypothetical protein ACREL7_18295 [Longimicrobiales bacterium]
MRLPARTYRRFGALALILTGSTAACDSLLDTTPDYAEFAHVRVTGSSDVPLKLVLSNNFTALPDDDGEIVVSLIDADTQVIDLPIDESYPLGEGLRILARLINPDTAVTATIHMRVFLDDDEVYSQQATMRDASLEYYFAYF